MLLQRGRLIFDGGTHIGRVGRQSNFSIHHDTSSVGQMEQRIGAQLTSGTALDLCAILVFGRLDSEVHTLLEARFLEQLTQKKLAPITSHLRVSSEGSAQLLRLATYGVIQIGQVLDTVTQRLHLTHLTCIAVVDGLLEILEIDLEGGENLAQLQSIALAHHLRLLVENRGGNLAECTLGLGTQVSALLVLLTQLLQQTGILGLQ